jgi:ubiquinone/menaquinone biosynthesis C-methylase UbiE
MSIERRVAAHYARSGLGEAALAALAAAGQDITRLSFEDLAPLDEFHLRGRPATAELAAALGLGAGMRVLDVGSGIGGPSRYVAATYDCRVVGIDLTEEYCRAAAFLAERVGLGDRIDYRPGSALAMPFPDAGFDAALTEHVAMNIEDKARLYREVARVLKPGARFGIYDVLRGEGGEVVYPVPWARDPSTSFLVRPGELETLLKQAGFALVSRRDTSAAARESLEQTRARMAEPDPPPAALRLLLPDDFQLMVENLARNLAEDRIRTAEVICRKA